MSSLQLEEVNIEGYKSFKHQNIMLTDMNVLIGQNGAGKSNFISLFRLLRTIIERRLKNFSKTVGSESLLYYGIKETKQIRIKLNFDPNYYEILLERSIQNDILFIEGEWVGFRGETYEEPYWKSVTATEEESNLSTMAKKQQIAKHVYDVLVKWRVYHFHDTSPFAEVKNYASFSDNKILFENASNLAPFLYRMREIKEDHYERIVKTVQLVMPFFKDFVLEPNFQNKETIRIEWQDKYSEKVFTANDLSDGSLRFICMATLLLQPVLPSVLLIDEPEIGLHPSAITILAGLLKKASKRTQVIVSTQSVSLVNEFDAEDIVVVERPGEETVMRRLDAEKLSAWLDEYSLGELWDKNVLGGKP
jgi:predicted ATPase